MIGAFLSALEDMQRPAIVRLLVVSALLAFLLVVTLAGSVGWLVAGITFVSLGWLERLIEATAYLGLVVLGLLLMPAAVGAVANLLLDRVAAEVERAHYPGIGAPRQQALLEAVVQALRFFCLLAVANLLALPLYLVPGLNLVVWLGLNGILLAREYIDLVAGRWHEPEAARALRRANRPILFVAGALLAGLLLIPLVNLLVPVFGTAFMAHIYHRVLRQSTPSVHLG